MKIYLSNKKPENSSHTHVSNIVSLDNTVTDSEATEIVVDNFLCQFSIGELGPALEKILSKLRLNSTLTIKDKDIDIVCMKHVRGDWSLAEVNSNLFQSGATKSFLNIETIQANLPNRFRVEKSYLDQQSGDFLIIARRLK